MTPTFDARLTTISNAFGSQFSVKIHCEMARFQLSFPQESSQFRVGMDSLNFLEMASRLPTNKLKMAAYDFGFNQNNLGCILTIGDHGASSTPLLPILREEFLSCAGSLKKKVLIASIAQIQPAAAIELLQREDHNRARELTAAACAFAVRGNRLSVIDILANSGHASIKRTENGGH